MMLPWLLFLAGLASLALPARADDADDPYLWLEDVTDEKALAWVRERNAREYPRANHLRSVYRARRSPAEILNSEEKIPGIEKAGSRYYNFWRDAQHPRGMWRRTTLQEYRKLQPRVGDGPGSR